MVFVLNREWTRMDANFSEEMGLFAFIRVHSRLKYFGKKVICG